MKFLKKIIAIVVLIGLMTFNSLAAPTLYKYAVDGSGNPITTTSPGNTVNWVVEVENPDNVPLYMELRDLGLSNNQNFTFSPYKDINGNVLPGANPEVPYGIFNGTLVPPTWEEILGVNNSTTNTLLQDGSWGYSNVGISSPSTGIVDYLLGHNITFDVNSNGDGYTPIFVVMPDGEKRIYAIYHHQYVWEPYGSFPDGSGGNVPTEWAPAGSKWANIMCVSITYDAPCEDYFDYGATISTPKAFSSHQEATAGGDTADQIAGFYTAWVHKDIATTLYPKYYIDEVNGRIYYVAARALDPNTVTDPGNNRATLLTSSQRQAEIGIGCWDYFNDHNCDDGTAGAVRSFYKVADLDFSMWFNTALTGPVMAEGLYFEGGKFYFYYQDHDGDFNTPDSLKFACYDIVADAVCGGYPYTYPGINLFKETFKAPFEVHDGKMYVLVNRSQYLSTTGAGDDMVVACFDTATGAKCSGWTDILIGPGVVSRNDGSDFGNSPSIFNLDGYAMCIGYDNLNSSGNGATQSSYCFDYTTGSQIVAMNNYVNILEDNVATHGDYNVTFTKPDGTLTTRIYITQDKIQNGDTGDVNRIYCYEDTGAGYVLCPDFGEWNGSSYNGYRDFNDCTETDSASNSLGCEPGLNIQYGYTMDPETTCMYGLAHSGNLWSFNPLTGSTPCLISSSSVMIEDPSTNYYCDEDITRTSDWLWYARVYNAEPGTYIARFYDPTVDSDPMTSPALEVVTVTVGATGTVDLIPTTMGRYETMGVYLYASELSFRPSDQKLQYSLNYYDQVIGDADNPQFCFETTVVNQCGLPSITNQASLAYATSTYPDIAPTPTAQVDSNISTLTIVDPASCFAGLGDYIWEDLNANGIQDIGEPGIENVIVTITDTSGNPVNDSGGNPVLPQTTGTDGLYLFENLPAGDYIITFTLPSDFVFTTQDATTDDLDSDANPLTGQTTTITLVEGQDQLTWDAGAYRPARLGDYVWEDLNANGIQDTGEPGYAGATVRLLDTSGNPVNDASGNPVADYTTLADGFYEFTNLVPGNYVVRFIPASGFHVVTSQDQGSDDNLDSDANPSTLDTVTITLVSGDDQDQWDAGIFQPVALGDIFWDDYDANGIRDSGEPSLEGVTVSITDGSGNPAYDVAGNLLGPITTSNNIVSGEFEYRYSRLRPGTYIVTFTLPTGYLFSPMDQGSDDTIDSDANTTTGATVVITMVSGQDQFQWDAGAYQPSSLGDIIWEDLNGNGVQDTGEPGIANVVVTLTDASGNPVTDAFGNTVLPQTTGTDGLYLFEDLLGGDYIVNFDNPDTRYIYSPIDAGGDDTLDSDVDTNGDTPVITIVPGEDQLQWDAGMYIPPVIGVAKDLSEFPTLSLDGSNNMLWDFQLTYRIQNLGQSPLVNIDFTENFETLFGIPAADVVSVSGYVVPQNPAHYANTAINPAFTGVTGGENVLTPTLADFLSPDEYIDVIIDVQIRKNITEPESYDNLVTAVADGTYDPDGDGVPDDADGDGIVDITLPVEDTSTDGTDTDPNGNDDPTDDTTPTPIPFEPPEIGVAKERTMLPRLSYDSSNNFVWTTEFTYRIENTGYVPLLNVTFDEDFQELFSSVGAAVPASDITINSTSIAAYDSLGNTNTHYNGVIDPLYTGTTAYPRVIVPTITDYLLPGDYIMVVINVSFVKNITEPEHYDNWVTAVSDGGYDYNDDGIPDDLDGDGLPDLSIPVTDISQDGADVDPDGNMDPTDNNDPTPVDIYPPEIGVAKVLSNNLRLRYDTNGDMVWTGQFMYRLENTGYTPLLNVTFDEPLDEVFGVSPAMIDLIGGSVTASNPTNYTITSLDPTYDATVNNPRVLVPTLSDFLMPGEYITVTIDFEFTKNINEREDYENQIIGTADSGYDYNGDGLPDNLDCLDDPMHVDYPECSNNPTLGVPVEDLSTDGTDVDPDSNEDPTDNGVPTPIFVLEPEIGVAKSLTMLPRLQYDLNGNFTWATQFTYMLKNTGQAPLMNVTFTEDFEELFSSYGDAVPASDIFASVTSANAYDALGNVNTHFTPDIDPTFNGTTLGGTQVLLPNLADYLLADEYVIVVIDVTFVKNIDMPEYYDNLVLGTAVGGYDYDEDGVPDDIECLDIPVGSDCGDGYSTSVPVEDWSQDQTGIPAQDMNPDPDNNDDPTDNNDPTPLFILPPEIGAAKRLSDGPTIVSGNPMVWDLEFKYIIENTGYVPLVNITYDEDFADVFNIPDSAVDVKSVTVYTNNAPNFDGPSSVDPLFTGNSVHPRVLVPSLGNWLAVGDSIEIAIRLHIEKLVTEEVTEWNDIVAVGDGTYDYDGDGEPDDIECLELDTTDCGDGFTTNVPVVDVADDGLHVDTNGNGDPSELPADDPICIENPDADGCEDDPTPIPFIPPVDLVMNEITPVCMEDDLILRIRVENVRYLETWDAKIEISGLDIDNDGSYKDDFDLNLDDNKACDVEDGNKLICDLEKLEDYSHDKFGDNFDDGLEIGAPGGAMLTYNFDIAAAKGLEIGGLEGESKGEYFVSLTPKHEGKMDLEVKIYDEEFPIEPNNDDNEDGITIKFKSCIELPETGFDLRLTFVLGGIILTSLGGYFYLNKKRQ